MCFALSVATVSPECPGVTPVRTLLLFANPHPSAYDTIKHGNTEVLYTLPLLFMPTYLGLRLSNVSKRSMKSTYIGRSSGTLSHTARSSSADVRHILTGPKSS